MEDRIIKVDYEDEMRKSYIDYAMSVIVQRAIPDVRDGFKPVQRRVLYAMDELSLTPDKQYRKSARIVGDTMGKYHPHGDSSIYDAMVRMSQDFNMLLPLVDGHGNFGSIDGDSPAAMRYTEARLSKIAMEVLKDMDKGIVDYRDNFDGSLKEPVVLPTKFPNLLVNGASGIAVGMKTDIPPHNLSEVINACKAYLDNEEITIPQIMKYIKGPDFPTGGIIVNKSELKNIYETGSGKIKVRAKIVTEDAGHGKTNLVVTEIPYSSTGNKTKLIEGIIELVKDRKLDEVTDVRDESSMEGIRIVIEAKRGVNIDNLINKLYSKTKLEDNVPVNFLAIVNKQPKLLNVKEIIKHFIDFQKEINIRKYQHLLDKSLEREEIVQGLIKAQDMIDLIIEILRGSDSRKTAKECMIYGKTDNIKFKTKKSQIQASKLNFTENQANAILEMRLQNLIGLELQKLKDELGEITSNIAEYRKILSNESDLKAVIKNDLEKIKKQYGKKRKTEIDEIVQEEYKEEFVIEDLYILIDRFGYIKAVDTQTYNRCSEDTLNEFNTILKALNTDKVCIFTAEGNLHQIKVLDIPIGKIKDKGVPIDTISNIAKEEPVLITTFDEIKDKKLLFATKLGYIKIVDGMEFESVRRNISSTKLIDGDSVKMVTPIDDTISHITMVTEDNCILRFERSEVPEQKRIAVGVITLKLKDNDKIANIYLTQPDENRKIRVNKKDIELSEIKVLRRNNKGIKIE